METALAVTPPEALTSFHAVAINAAEMASAGVQVRGYIEQQSADVSGELAELKDAHEIAVMAGWKTEAIERCMLRLRKRQRYLTHLLSAVDHGYAIVPNMPCTVFAIRTNAAKPKYQETAGRTLNAAQWGSKSEREQLLGAGVGRYVNPVTLGEHDIRQVPVEAGATNTREEHTWTVTEFDDIEFPLVAAHPHVMDATTRAMALKIFDRIAIVPETRPKGDPIILGQIVQAKDRAGSERVVSCLIAWHLDLRTI